MKLLKINKIEKETSYDIEVEYTHCFFASGILVHNSNAGVSYNNTHGLWAQSREQIITVNEDNAAFAFHVHSNKNFYTKSLKEFAVKNGVDLDKYSITVYSEWAGGSIQKTVGITKHQKSSFIFGVKVAEPGNEDFKSYWIDSSEFPRDEENNIYNIYDFKTYEMEIDFKRPDIAQNKMIEIMLEVEDMCPVAKQLGHEGLGEGNVWTVEFKGEVYRWKVKGDKHAGKSKVKKLKKVDSVKINKIHEVVNKVTPTWRLDQMLTESCNLNNGGNIDREKLGDYIRMVIKDIMKEELDIISEAGLEPKEINSYVSHVARDYFFDRERADLGVE